MEGRCLSSQMPYFYNEVVPASRAGNGPGYNPTSHLNQGPYGPTSKAANNSTSRTSGVSKAAHNSEIPPIGPYRNVTRLVGAGPSTAVYNRPVAAMAKGPAITPSASTGTNSFRSQPDTSAYLGRNAAATASGPAMSPRA